MSSSGCGEGGVLRRGSSTLRSQTLPADPQGTIETFTDLAEKKSHIESRQFNYFVQFQVVEPAGNKEEKMLNYEIGIALGSTITPNLLFCAPLTWLGRK